ncbi:lysis system i-spanin subunit Rz [Providencia rettgeri]|uniref:Lysis system i-spanin subunit Rz n=2 Tax=Providencia rettgeri TaxID=587 RepID=A0AAJ4NJ07_PRORE|nr:lysis system i-spanin subunit Rz [Providencia rettgeri]QWQ16555.2 lysis system i-spanin subunit Rz [Providencia rettgeri]QWQ20390.2 lysis system i-spanin subunit Rz [Providencia rettgeri]QWQ24225.2 lysis system i-spanin subunit Rz [Providencia rettgeri]
MNSITENTLTRSLKIALIVGAWLLFAAGAFAGVMLARYHYNTIIQTNQATHASQLKAISDEASAATRQAILRMEDAQREKARLDTYYTQELAREKAQSQALRDDLSTGRRRLQFARADLATCQLTASHHSSARTVGDGAEIQFSVEAGLLVEDIRADIKRDQDKLDYLQGYVKDVVKECRREVTPWRWHRYYGAVCLC